MESDKGVILLYLSWHLSLADLSLSWLECTLDSLATTPLKNCCSLSQPVKEPGSHSGPAATFDLLIEESHTIYYSIPNAASHHSIVVLVRHWHAWVREKGIDSLSHVSPSTPLATRTTYLASLAHIPINLSHILYIYNLLLELRG